VLGRRHNLTYNRALPPLNDPLWSIPEGISAGASSAFGTNDGTNGFRTLEESCYALYCDWCWDEDVASSKLDKVENDIYFSAGALALDLTMFNLTVSLPPTGGKLNSFMLELPRFTDYQWKAPTGIPKFGVVQSDIFASGYPGKINNSPFLIRWRFGVSQEWYKW
jgi:hypothetical protein